MTNVSVTLPWDAVPSSVRNALGCPFRNVKSVTLSRFDDGKVWLCCSKNALAAWSAVLPDNDYDADSLAVLMDWVDTLV